jgi:hypothetical protein
MTTADDLMMGRRLAAEIAAKLAYYETQLSWFQEITEAAEPGSERRKYNLQLVAIRPVSTWPFFR